GYINKMPTFAYLNKTTDAPNTFFSPHNFSMTALENDWKRYFTYFDKTKNSLELTDGSFVGYEKVTKKEIGNGYSVYKYTTSNTYPNVSESTYTYNNVGLMDSFLISNSSFPSLNVIDYDVKRGKLINERHFSEEGYLKQSVNYEYTYDVFDVLDL
ncbi:hypothetical protein, partial [Kordia jejudonensis]|uniref:hypothetical protein n=1 Tax=Kordia jejudonensis TaxID=1348245 RepID=UPI00062947E5